MGKKEFQIKYYERLLREDIGEYLKSLNDNKVPYDLDIFNRKIDKIMETIKKIIDSE